MLISFLVGEVTGMKSKKNTPENRGVYQHTHEKLRFLFLLQLQVIEKVNYFKGNIVIVVCF